MDGTMDKQGRDSLEQFSVQNNNHNSQGVASGMTTIESHNPRERLERRMQRLNQTTALLSKKVTGVNFYLHNIAEKSLKIKSVDKYPHGTNANYPISQ